MDSSSIQEPSILRRFALPAIILGALALNAVLLMDSYRSKHPESMDDSDQLSPESTAAPSPHGGSATAGTATTQPESSQPGGSATSATSPDSAGRGSEPPSSQRRYTWLTGGGKPVAEESAKVVHESEPQRPPSKPVPAPPPRSSPDTARAAVRAPVAAGADVARVPQPAPPTPSETNRPKPETVPEETETDPDSDRKPPVLVSLRLDPPEVNDGSASNVLIEMSDDLSGVKSVSGRFRSPSGKALIPFEAQGATGNPLYTAALRIPPKAETGRWYLSDLIAYDKANNPLIANFSAATSPPGGQLLVTSSDSDSAPPSVRDIVIDPPTLRGGETANLRIDIEDDVSGVASIWGTFRSKSGAGTLNFSARPQGGQNVPGPGPVVWEGVVPIPANADCGEWKLQQLVVADKAGNSARLAEETPSVAAAQFYVSSDSCDSAAPVLESVTLSPNVVSNTSPSEIIMTAIVTDEGTGATAMLVSIVGPPSTNGQAPRVSVQGSRASNDPASPWIARIPVPEFAAKGIWRVTFVRLQDRASNIRDYKPEDQVLANATFEVR